MILNHTRRRLRFAAAVDRLECLSISGFSSCIREYIGLAADLLGPYNGVRELNWFQGLHVWLARFRIPELGFRVSPVSSHQSPDQTRPDSAIAPWPIVEYAKPFSYLLYCGVVLFLTYGKRGRRYGLLGGMFIRIGNAAGLR